MKAELWSGRAMGLGTFHCRGVLHIWKVGGQEPNDVWQ